MFLLAIDLMILAGRRDIDWRMSKGIGSQISSVMKPMICIKKPHSPHFLHPYSAVWYHIWKKGK